MDAWASLSLAPAVAAMRLPLLASESGAPFRWPTETIRATVEKVAAVAEGATVAQMAIARSAWSFWPEVMLGRSPSLFNGVAVEQSLQAALEPVGKAVKANHRRLSRR